MNLWDPALNSAIGFCFYQGKMNFHCKALVQLLQFILPLVLVTVLLESYKYIEQRKLLENFTFFTSLESLPSFTQF